MRSCIGVTLNTRDLRLIREFYVEMLCLPIRAEQDNDSLTIELGEALLTFQSFYGKPESWAEIHLEVDDVPHFCHRMRLAGNDIRREWHDRAELVDPDKRKVVVWQVDR